MFTDIRQKMGVLIRLQDLETPHFFKRITTHGDKIVNWKLVYLSFRSVSNVCFIAKLFSLTLFTATK